MRKNVKSAIKKVEELLKENEKLSQEVIREIKIDFNLWNAEIDYIVDKFSENIEPSINEPKIMDLSRTDYEEIYKEVLAKKPELKTLIKRIKDIPPPQSHETSDLLRKFKDGDTSVLDRLVLMHMRPVLKQALVYNRNFEFDLEDTIEDGFMLIFTAIDKFDVNTSGYFLSYLSLVFQSQMFRLGKSVWFDVYYPIHVKELFNSAIRFYNENDLMKEDLDENLEYWATEFANSVSEVDIELARDLLKFLNNKMNHYIYYSDLTNEDFLYILDDTDKLDFTKKIFEEDLKNSINLDCLTDREREIVSLRFGLDNNKPHTLQAIGQKYNLTRERIRQILNIALDKLRNQYFKYEIDDFL